MEDNPGGVFAVHTIRDNQLSIDGRSLGLTVVA